MIVIPPPPVVLRGATRRAGLGVSTTIPELDFETYSEAGYVWNETDQKWRSPEGAPGTTRGLSVVGAAVYAMHPTADILSASYNLKDGRGERWWVPGMPPPQDLFDYLATGGPIEAWNVGFERWIWLYVAHKKYGWPMPQMHQWRCAMAKAAAFAMPRKLDLAAQVMDLPTKKDPDGTRLLNKFTKPRNPTKGDPRRRITLAEDPDDAQRLIRYNITDTVAESQASERCPDLTGESLAFWQLDQIVNVRGAPVDREGILACCDIVRQCLVKYNAELQALTGIDAASKVQQIQKWLGERGVYLPSLDEEAVDEALTRLGLDSACRRVLEIRQAAGSASVKKVFSMALRMTPDDRLHDLYNFHGARTGRPTGEGPQPTNLPKAGPNVYLCKSCGRYHGGHVRICPWCGVGRVPAPPGATDKPQEWSFGAARDAMEVIAKRSITYLEWMFGEALLTVAGCLRGLYRARPGYDLISSDYSAIEAVVSSELADVAWRKEVFATHGKIYEASAATAYKVPLEEILGHKKLTGQHHPLRAKGKINELALGFGGWVNALVAFGAPGTTEELERDVKAWRAASPGFEWIWGGQTCGKANSPLANSGRQILSYDRNGKPDTWDSTPFFFGIEGAVVQALLNRGTWYPVNRMDGSFAGITYGADASILYCVLPSGRVLHYHSPRLDTNEQAWRGLSVVYEGYNSNPKNGGIGWIDIRSWGSRFFENVVQAIAHDIQRYGMLALEAAGYSIVLHTYDENVSEVPVAFGSIDEFETIMNRMPLFAHRLDGTVWPIKATGGWRAPEYRKE